MNKARLIIITPFIMGFCQMGLLLSAQDQARNTTAIGEGLVTRAYRAPTVFVPNMRGSWYQRYGGSGYTDDPFVETDPNKSGILKGPKVPFPGLQEALETYGITFPEGSYVKHDPDTGKFEIRGNSDTIELFEAYIDSRNQRIEKLLNVRAEIYQMPAKAALKLQQLCGPMDDHTLIWEKVHAMVERNQASLVTTTSIMARSGQRSRAEEVSELIYPTEVDWDNKEETVLPKAFETRNVGTTFEVDPVLGADQFTVDLSFSLEHHTAPPIMRPINVTSPNTGRVVVVEMPEFHTKHITTQITLGINSTKCIGAWRPTGKPEYEKDNVMQIVFLRVDLQTTGKIVPWKE